MGESPLGDEHLAELASLNSLMFSRGMTTIDNTKWLQVKGMLANTSRISTAFCASVREPASAAVRVCEEVRLLDLHKTFRIQQHCCLHHFKPSSPCKEGGIQSCPLGRVYSW